MAVDLVRSVQILASSPSWAHDQMLVCSSVRHLRLFPWRPALSSDGQSSALHVFMTRPKTPFNDGSEMVVCVAAVFGPAMILMLGDDDGGQVSFRRVITLMDQMNTK